MMLSFLPMLPPQILLNNLLYDSSQFTIPLDGVDLEEIKRPRTLSIKNLKRFLVVFGPLSSIFDFLTFGVLLVGFHLSQGQFQTGWFIESMATQVFVVYIIRTRKIPFVQSWPSLPLVCGTIGAVLLAIFLGLGPLNHLFGFSAIGLPVMAAIGGIVLIYLILVQIVKSWFARKFGFVASSEELR